MLLKAAANVVWIKVTDSSRACIYIPRLQKPYKVNIIKENGTKHHYRIEKPHVDPFRHSLHLLHLKPGAVMFLQRILHHDVNLKTKQAEPN